VRGTQSVDADSVQRPPQGGAAPSPRRRRTVLGRVLLSYGVITTSFALVAGYSLMGQQRSVRETENMRSGHIPLVVVLRDVVAGQNTFNSQLNNITEVNNPADKQVWFESQLALGRPKVFAELRSALNRAFVDDGAAIRRQLLDEASTIEQFVEGDREILARLFDALKRADAKRAEQLRDQLVTRGSQALGQLRALEGRVNAQLDALMTELTARERIAFWVLVTWVSFTIALGGGVALYARRVLSPLARITERANAVAKGDLTPHPAILVNDEIGDLARTFESMVLAIARANRELLESERLATIGKMAAHVTHEVRNPLSSIALNLELLEDELPKESEARALHHAIQREVERLTELTEQYLSLARPNRPDLQAEDLGEIVRSTARFLEPDVGRVGIKLVCNVESNLPEVLVDEAQLRQVLHNLVRNARQAMSDGGTIRLYVGQGEHDTVQVRVEDEGVGIAPEVRARLFEPFLTTKGQGTGLGLAISRHIVEAHRGSIRCEPNAPRGARFIIELPVAAG
jgi:two-component system, NtrC family, sensor kinase